MPPLNSDDSTSHPLPDSFGSFRVLHQIGKGTLGAVLQTYEPEADRLVAVKVFQLDITPEQAEELSRELQVVSQQGLTHPSIVEPLAAGIEDGIAYLATEYVASESLDVAMRHYAPAPFETTLALVTQLADGLDFSHAAGVEHGLLHPRDIFVTSERARVTGFGIARALEKLEIVVPVRRPYSAPELITGDNWTSSADIYSLAAIVYELLTGRCVTVTGEPMANALAETIEDSQAKALADVLTLALADDPNHRYSTALEFASALESVKDSEKTSAVSVSRKTESANGASNLLTSTTTDLNKESVVSDEFGGKESDHGEGGPPAHNEPTMGRLWDDLDDVDVHTESEHVVELNDLGEIQGGQSQPKFFGEDEVFDESVATNVSDEFSEAVEHSESTRRQHSGVSLDSELSVVSDESLVRGEAGQSVGAQSLLGTDSMESQKGHSRLKSESSEKVNKTYLSQALTNWRPLGVAVGFCLLIGFVAWGGWGKRGVETQEFLNEPNSDVEGKTEIGAAERKAVDRILKSETVSIEKDGISPVIQDSRTRDSASVREGNTGLGDDAILTRSIPLKNEPVPYEFSRPVVTGRLLIRTSPADASVVVNGVSRGRSPLVLRDLSFGSYRIDVTKAGHLSASRTLMISSDNLAASTVIPLRSVLETEESEVVLRDRYQTAEPVIAEVGSVYIDSQPRTARVFIDGAIIGRTPLLVSEVISGAREIRVEYEGYRDWLFIVEITANERNEVLVSLEAEL